MKSTFLHQFTAMISAKIAWYIARNRMESYPLGWARIGRFFNDAHNVIAREGVTMNWPWFLKQCRLRAFDFHALVGNDEEIPALHCHGTVASYQADLGDDSNAYLETLRKLHRTIARQQQKNRKMEREVGPLRLEIDCRSANMRDLLIHWKRQQYRRTHILDLFSPAWTRRLVADLHTGAGDGRCRTGHESSMQGLLSVLWAGDHAVAAHFGIREDDLIHYWLPAFNTGFAKYSPGTALYTAIIAASSAHGIRCIDMGYGEQPYKLKQTDKISRVAYGCISRSRIHNYHRSMNPR